MADSDKSPRTLACRFLLFAAAVSVSYLVLLFFCGRCYDKNNHSYVAAQIDKMENLKKTPTPRIVFLGGSNLAFGLDSARVSQAFGVPVINMGLHAGLGMKYMLDSARPWLRKGDLVVFMPEYSSFLGDGIGGDSTLLELFGVSHDLRMLKYLTPSMLLQVNGLIVSWRPGATTEAPPYNRDSFNRDGDMVGHLSMAPKPVPMDMMNSDLNIEAINYLAEYVRGCDRNGIKTVVLFPNYRRTNYQRNHPYIQKIESALRQSVPAIMPVRPADFVFDDRNFFDTKYHLNAAGRGLSAGKVIAALRASHPSAKP